MPTRAEREEKADYCLTNKLGTLMAGIADLDQQAAALSAELRKLAMRDLIHLKWPELDRFQATVREARYGLNAVKKRLTEAGR